MRRGYHVRWRSDLPAFPLAQTPPTVALRCCCTVIGKIERTSASSGAVTDIADDGCVSIPGPIWFGCDPSGPAQAARRLGACGPRRDADEAIRPTGIIGVSTVPKLFNREVITAMAEVNELPIIFLYSNPTSRSECTAEEAYRWSDGRAVFASGSPFPPVEINGRHFVPGQGNNVYIFPAMGMAVFPTEANRLTEEMFIVAAQAVAEQVSEGNLSTGLIYPPQSRILEASLHVAEGIAGYIFDQGLARAPRPEDVGALVRARTY
jgi:malic enzyme